MLLQCQRIQVVIDERGDVASTLQVALCHLGHWESIKQSKVLVQLQQQQLTFKRSLHFEIYSFSKLDIGPTLEYRFRYSNNSIPCLRGKSP